jgi:hypothetical protein
MIVEKSEGLSAGQNKKPRNKVRTPCTAAGLRNYLSPYKPRPGEVICVPGVGGEIGPWSTDTGCIGGRADRDDREGGIADTPGGRSGGGGNGSGLSRNRAGSDAAEPEGICG